MRYHYPTYPGLLAEYEERLEQQIEAGHITESTKEAYLDHADKLFETLIVAIPQTVMEAYVQARGFKGPYAQIIRELKEIAIGRQRPA
jgi:hypothetical protein